MTLVFNDQEFVGRPYDTVTVQLSRSNVLLDLLAPLTLVAPGQRSRAPGVALDPADQIMQEQPPGTTDLIGGPILPLALTVAGGTGATCVSARVTVGGGAVGWGGAMIPPGQAARALHIPLGLRPVAATSLTPGARIHATLSVWAYSATGC